MEHVFGDIEGIGREGDLVGSGADADGHAVGFARGALKVADQEGDEVGGHLGGGEELEGVFADALAGFVVGGVGFDRAVGDGGVGAVDDE